MEFPWPALLAAVLAAVLTYADLDTVFEAPPTLGWMPWFKLCVAWWGFVLVNGALAALLYYALDESEVIKAGNRWLKGLAIGAGYSALIRAKLTTLSVNGRDVPVGLETFYEGFKGLIHRRINRIIRQWRADETERLIQLDIPTLRVKARSLVMSDSLLTQEQKQKTLAWIDEIANDAGLQDGDRRTYLATFIVSGQTHAKS